ncbi:DUF3017 domain-containing protein [Streptomyces sp. NPDC059740]|uniref:DUF3017 domain-containing protein n=1 Tax=Streptomyces sp. NPDC059740 TaxID=3346926 RepID=UPI003654B91A
MGAEARGHAHHASQDGEDAGRRPRSQGCGDPPEPAAGAQAPAGRGGEDPARPGGGEHGQADGEQTPPGREHTEAAGERSHAGSEDRQDDGDGAHGPRGSRRFPTLTRDTARPEGGGRTASGDAPAPARQWPMLTVIAGVALGLLLVAVDVFRVGALVVGLTLVAGAVLRRVLPVVGMLAVRSRFTDMLIYGGLGVVIILLALMAQPRPLLEIPFLNDLVHFSVR